MENKNPSLKRINDSIKSITRSFKNIYITTQEAEKQMNHFKQVLFKDLEKKEQ